MRRDKQLSSTEQYLIAMLNARTMKYFEPCQFILTKSRQIFITYAIGYN